MAMNVRRATNYTIGVTYTKGGVAGNLTGGMVYFTVKPVEYDSDASDTTAVITKDVATHTDAANGLSAIALTPSDTVGLDQEADYWYDIVVVDADGERYVIDEGKFSVNASPTNRGV